MSSEELPANNVESVGERGTLRSVKTPEKVSVTRQTKSLWRPPVKIERLYSSGHADPLFD